MSEPQSGPVGPRQAPGPILDRLRSSPAGQQFENVQDVARALGLGTEEGRS
jgi:hypothetical protein